MLKQKIVWLALISLLLVAMTGCGKGSEENVNHFIDALKDQKLKVKDITKEVSKDMPNFDEKRNTVLLVEETEKVYIEMPEDVEIDIQEKTAKYTNPLADFVGIPHLYKKGDIVITYFGDHQKLLEIMEKEFGKSLVN